MADVADRMIVGSGTATPAYDASRARAFLRAQPGRVLSDDEMASIVGAIWYYAGLLAQAGAPIDPALAFAQFCVETNNGRFTGEVPARARNPAGIGAIGDGSYITYPDWMTGILAYYLHLLAWAGRIGLAGKLTTWAAAEVDVRVPLVAQVLAVKGAATTWRSLGGRWAVDGDVPWQQQASRADKPNYGQKIASRYAQVLATVDSETPTGGSMNAQQRTDDLIKTLQARGRTVVDMRGKLPINPDPRYRYGLLAKGLGGVAHYIQHWTGDAFSRATIAKITGTDYGLDTIPEKMTQADEIDMLVWYANFHISKDGSTWGGIAYGVMIFPSGRIYVNWNIGTLTYHAFSENAESYAICCPNSNGQAPTQAQLVSLNHVWHYLCEETPEAPAGWADLYGHTEAKRFDAQNQTTCPGAALLAHVQRARATQAPTVPVILSGSEAAGPSGEVAAIKALAESIPYQQRGELQWEGVIDLSTPDFGGGNAEPLAKYERLVVHGLNGQPYILTLDLWDRLRKEGKIRAWPKGEVVPFDRPFSPSA